uniref:F-box protein CPR30-like isoform X1 n=1 Tax=Fragaria vesca subsp. vesca TaxID=101020 RepID=UPI0005CA286D|nr:PREDICTED: F-box protein CPR30-like isoform X1 [Fragaria vesca subsp. vesca]
MAETEDLPEEIILNIFSRLPVKSLIRFTSVSKRLHFIILSDPKFAQSQLKAAPRLSRRLLVSTDAPQLESLPLDADTPSFGDPYSVRKLTLPFLHQPGGYVQLLGSCNGLVFLSVDKKFYYVWNPSLGFVKKLPESYVSLSNRESESNVFYGVGYLSATDDYTVLVASYDFTELQLDITEDMSSIVEMFSLRTHTWERIESSVGFNVEPYCQGTLVNDALHWLNFYDDEQEIVCFDLAAKEFRGMWLPDFNNDGKSIRSLGVCEGCLFVSRYAEGVCDSVDLWVMREYGVSDSWTMLFCLKVPDPPVWRAFGRKLLVVESSTFAVNWSVEGCQLIRIDHKENRKVDQYMLKGILMCMVEYEESLLWISGYQSVKETEQVPILETAHKASQSRN